jgi:hypothetical protein
VPGSVAPGFYPIEVRCEGAGARWRGKLWLDVEPPIEATARLAGGQILLNVRSLGDAPVQCEAELEPEGSIRVTDRSLWFEAASGEEGTTVAVPILGPAEAGGRALATVSAGRYEVRMQVPAPALDVAVVSWHKRAYEGEVTSEQKDDQLVIRSASKADRGGWGMDTARLRPGSTVTFAIECRTEEVVSTDGGALVRAIFLHRDGAGRAAGEWVMSEAMKGTTDWQTVTVAFAVPPDTGRVQIELFNWHAAGASYWRNPTITVR